MRGLGLRINTPIGPIGIDYGYLLDQPSFVTTSGAVLRQPSSISGSVSHSESINLFPQENS
jgi:hypothetical protein